MFVDKSDLVTLSSESTATSAEITRNMEITITPNADKILEKDLDEIDTARETIEDVIDNNLESRTLSLNKSIFVNICDLLIENPQSISKGAFWIPQVITNGVQCIMWSLWKPNYTGITKRIVLFSNMNVQVSKITIFYC